MVTVLIVPGAWLPITSYRRLIRALEEEGFEVAFAAYPSFKPRGDPSQVSCLADTVFVRDRVLVPLLDRGKEVVVVMHSYGGMPGAAAATGLSRRVRQIQGKPGGILGLIMISGYMVREGKRCVDARGGSLPSWVLQDRPRAGLCMIDSPRQVLAADVPEEVTSVEFTLLEPHGTRCFLTAQPRPAFATSEYRGLLMYLKLKNDRAIPLATQESMIAETGVSWKTRRMTASHYAPLATRVEETVKVISDYAQEFKSKNS